MLIIRIRAPIDQIRVLIMQLSGGRQQKERGGRGEVDRGARAVCSARCTVASIGRQAAALRECSAQRASVSRFECSAGPVIDRPEARTAGRRTMHETRNIAGDMQRSTHYGACATCRQPNVQPSTHGAQSASLLSAGAVRTPPSALAIASTWYLQLRRRAHFVAVRATDCVSDPRDRVHATACVRLPVQQVDGHKHRAKVRRRLVPPDVAQPEPPKRHAPHLRARTSVRRVRVCAWKRAAVRVRGAQSRCRCGSDEPSPGADVGSAHVAQLRKARDRVGAKVPCGSGRVGRVRIAPAGVVRQGKARRPRLRRPETVLW